MIQRQHLEPHAPAGPDGSARFLSWPRIASIRRLAPGAPLRDHRVQHRRRRVGPLPYLLPVQPLGDPLLDLRVGRVRLGGQEDLRACTPRSGAGQEQVARLPLAEQGRRFSSSAMSPAHRPPPRFIRISRRLASEPGNSSAVSAACAVLAVGASVPVSRRLTAESSQNIRSASSACDHPLASRRRRSSRPHSAMPVWRLLPSCAERA